MTGHLDADADGGSSPAAPGADDRLVMYRCAFQPDPATHAMGAAHAVPPGCDVAVCGVNPRLVVDVEWLTSPAARCDDCWSALAAELVGLRPFVQGGVFLLTSDEAARS